MRLSPAEWQLMNAAWRVCPATAREIAAGRPAGKRWAYTTVKTMLSRLVAKGALAERKVGNTSLYEPLITRQKARGIALRSLVAEAFDGALGSLVHFAVEEEKLSPAELRRLAETLEKSRKEGRRS